MVSQAGQGGTTLVADNLQITPMLSEGLKTKLRNLGVRYIRNLSDESMRGAPDFFMSWQGAFQTADVEDALRKGNTEASVLRRCADNQRRLRHTSWSPVFLEHP